MSRIKALLKPPVQTAVALRARRLLAPLREASDPTTAAIAAVLDGALRSRPDAEVAGWVRRIEQERRALLRSAVRVRSVDYGAGDGPAPRAPEVMWAGVPETISLAEACRASTSPFWSRVLLGLVRAFLPATCLEFGTCVGIGAAYLGAGQRLNGAGRTVSLEGSPALAREARALHRRLGLDHVRVVTGRFLDTLDGVLADLGAVDLAYVDGHHDEAATVAYFERLLPHLPDGALVIFDDVSWSEGMGRAWARLRAHPRVAVSFGLHDVGLCATGAGAGRHFDVPIPFH